MQLPQRIGRYRVQAPIGTGGFATVVRAYDEALDDSVAVKVLADNWAADADIRRRFVEEARLLRRLRSDDLVTVHDIGELDDGRPYFVMTFADHGSLADRLSGRPGAGLDPFAARKIVDALAGGLGALHAAGVVHRDVNPRNLLLRSSGAGPRPEVRRVAQTQVRIGLIGADERLLLGDLGLAKDFVRSGSAGASVIGGTPFFLAPEQLDPTFAVGPAADVYAATGVLWQAITTTPPPPPERLRSELGAVDEAWRPFFERGFAEDPDLRYPDMASWAEAARRLVDEAADVVAPSPLRSVRAPTASSPYKGLAAFQPEDATRFFGRDELVAVLVARLDRNRMLVVGGPSGSGKSSLVRAGLIPAMGAGALPGSERWPVALYTPRAGPVAELSYHVAKLARAVTHRSGSLDTLITHDRDEIRYQVDLITEASGGLLMVIDQFEELFTLNGRQQQEEFVAMLSDLVDPSGSRLRLVLALRADFYGACATFPWLADRISTNQVLVGPMTRNELRQAIEQPALVAALRLEEGLVDAALDDGGDEPGALPLVSHAMAETWRRRHGTLLTLAAYREAGGVAGAIAKTADATYGELAEDERESCRRLMLRLVTPGEGTADTRRRVSVADLQSDADPGVTLRVMGVMVDARLLTIDRDSIEIAHEALLGTWPRLRRWIDESRDALRTRQHIAYAAREWIAQDRHPDLLYRGTPLQSALEWATAHGDVLGPDDRAFLAAAETALRAEEQQREEAALRARRRRRIGVSILALLAAVAAAASLIAFSALGQATSRFGQSLATQAAATVRADPRAALALAVEAMARGAPDSYDARVALVEASAALDEAVMAPLGSAVAVGDALSVAVSAGGDLVATGNRDGTVVLWRPEGAMVGPPLAGHVKAVTGLVFTPDGTGLVSASVDGTVRLWDVRDPSAIPVSAVLGETGVIVWSVDVAPDGTLVASAGEDGTIRLYDLASRSQLGQPVVDTDRDFLTVAFSADGSLLLAGNGRGEITGWSLPDRSLALPTFNAHESDVWEIVFSPDGAAFATASSDGRIRVWATTDGAQLGEPFSGAAADVRGVQMIAGARLIAGDERGRMWVSAFDGSGRMALAGPHRGQITASAVGGSILATLGMDQLMQTWSPSPETTATVFDGYSGGAFGVAVSPDGEFVAVGDGEGNVRIVALGDGRTAAGPVRLHEGVVWALAYDATGDLLASGSADGSVVLLAPASGEVVERLDAGDARVSAAVFAGDRLVTGSGDGIVRIWRDGVLEARLGPHDGEVTGLALAPDGTLAAADFSGRVRFWDVEAARQLGDVLVADDNAIHGVAWSADGGLLATASADEVVHLWDAADLSRVAALTPQPGGATGVAFLADGLTLASTSGAGGVQLWDVALARTVGPALGGHTGTAWRIVAMPTGTRFVTTSADGSVRVWDVLDAARACDRAAGAFDEEHRRRALGENQDAKGCDSP